MKTNLLIGMMATVALGTALVATDVATTTSQPEVTIETETNVKASTSLEVSNIFTNSAAEESSAPDDGGSSAIGDCVDWGEVEVKWQTSCAVTSVSWVAFSERDLSSYNIQRSHDGKSWLTVHSVKSEGAEGERTEYNWEDADYGHTPVMYRIESNCMNGTRDVSVMVDIDGDCDGRVINIDVAPSPMKAECGLFITGLAPGPVQMRIVDLTGRVVYHRDWTSYSDKHELELDLTTELPSGMYMIHINNDGYRGVKKFSVRN